MLDLFFRKYAWIATLALLLAGASIVARAVSTLLGSAISPRIAADLSTRSGAAGAAPSPRPVVLDDLRLHHLLGIPPPAPEQATAPPGTLPAKNCQDPSAVPVRTALRLSLVGGVVADHPPSSLATLLDLATRKPFVLGVGDRAEGTELLGLQRVRLDGDATGNAFEVIALICNGGRKEYVGFADAGALPDGPTTLGPAAIAPTFAGVRVVGPNRYQVDRKVIDDALNDTSSTLTQGRVVPSFKDGVANGFKLASVQPGSLFAAIGVENGDVIQRINGYELNSLEKALELYQQLRTSSHVTIDLERRGAPVRKEYFIGGP